VCAHFKKLVLGEGEPCVSRWIHRSFALWHRSRNTNPVRQQEVPRATGCGLLAQVGFLTPPRKEHELARWCFCLCEVFALTGPLQPPDDAQRQATTHIRANATACLDFVCVLCARCFSSLRLSQCCPTWSSIRRKPNIAVLTSRARRARR
jgi:hypothetical protein